MNEPMLAERLGQSMGFPVRIDGKTLHRHPVMERKHGLDAGHVIVDRDAFEAAVTELKAEGDR